MPPQSQSQSLENPLALLTTMQGTQSASVEPRTLDSLFQELGVGDLSQWEIVESTDIVTHDLLASIQQGRNEEAGYYGQGQAIEADVPVVLDWWLATGSLDTIRVIGPYSEPVARETQTFLFASKLYQAPTRQEAEAAYRRFLQQS